MVDKFSLHNTQEKVSYNLCEIIEFEFPSIVKDGELFSLDLCTIIKNTTYKKCFVKDHLIYNLTFNTFNEELCAAELWIIRNNPKYDYLYKEEKITL